MTIAGRLPNLTSNVTQLTAVGKGFFAEEGLEVENVIVEDVRAALASGSVDVAEVEAGLLVQAVQEGLDFVIVAGKRCAESYTIAIQPDIATAADLAGKDVLLGGLPGDPNFELRKALLKLNGWDLDSVDGINYVTVPGGSNAWTELFYQGELAVTPFFSRHRTGMEEYGANIAVDTNIEWGNDYYVMRRSFIDENPNAVGRFVRALVKGQSYWLDPANKDEVLGIMAGFGYDNETEIAGFDGQKEQFCENMYVSEEYLGNNLRAAGIADADIPPFDQLADLEYLFNAQNELGLNNEGTPGALHDVDL
jgi:ABC-type nitrate/sulfonate/bicarbonate transport system substrate-binding protein